MGVLQAGVGIRQPETWFFGEEYAHLPTRFLLPAAPAKRSQDGPSATSGAGSGPCSPPCVPRSLVAAASAGSDVQSLASQLSQTRLRPVLSWWETQLGKFQGDLSRPSWGTVGVHTGSPCDLLLRE